MHGETKVTEEEEKMMVDNDDSNNNNDNNSNNSSSSRSPHPSSTQTLTLEGFTAFVSDLRLIWRNCGLYNASDSHIVQQVCRQPTGQHTPNPPMTHS